MKSKAKKPSEIVHRKFRVPIYDVKFFIVVGDSVDQARKKFNSIFGDYKSDGGQTAAICSRRGENFGIFFEKGNCTPDIVFHELFHSTHRILEWTGAEMDARHHEHAALLHGWLCKQTLDFIELDLRKSRKNVS